MIVRRVLVAAIAGALVTVPAIAPSASADDALPASFPVAGAGFGHAVGMSQWGAYGMAKDGYDAAGIATHYYSGTVVTPAQDDMDARINLLYHVGSAKMRTEVLDPTGGAIEVTVGATVAGGGVSDEFRFAVNGPNVSVQKVSAGVVTDLGVAPTVTVRWAGTRVPATAAGGPTLLNVAGPSTSLDSAGHRYRFGYVEVVPVSTSGGVKLNVVNSVRVHDEYLYGISEVSSSWPMAALQAQVLAARTYALSKVSRGVRQVCSCNMDDGGGPYYDQTFTGWIKASSAKGQNWVDAVNSTATSPTTGSAILFNGQPISAFYSASSGGPRSRRRTSGVATSATPSAFRTHGRSTATTPTAPGPSTHRRRRWRVRSALAQSRRSRSRSGSCPGQRRQLWQLRQTAPPQRGLAASSRVRSS